MNITQPAIAKPQKIAQKSIAIASGKGGVGKTTTAVNLAIYYARQKLRVGLIDLDPLSDIAIIFDIQPAEATITQAAFNKQEQNFQKHVVKIFDNLDLIFPMSKLGRDDSAVLYQKLYNQYSAELANNYDILLFDLPAGVIYKDNLVFLKQIDNLIVVTNAEPTAHVSAGSYIRQVLDLKLGNTIYLWHNKFEFNLGQGFDPKDVLGNYNRYVTDEVKLKKEELAGSIKDLAFIPKDKSLDLLQNNLSIALGVQRNILDVLESLHLDRLTALATRLRIPPKVFNLIKYFVMRTPHENNPEKLVDQLGLYIINVLQKDSSKIFGKKIVFKGNLTPAHIFTDKQREHFAAYFKVINIDPLRISILKLIKHLEKSNEELANSHRPFQMLSNLATGKIIDIEISKLLMILNNAYATLSHNQIRTAGLLLFYFSLNKLLQSPTLLKLIKNFIPQKRNQRGDTIRDRHTQIKNLIEKNKDYEQKYFQMIKTLFPLVDKQLATMVKTFGLMKLVFIDENQKVNKVAYLKLFSNFLHDLVNSGLSIVVGFEYRPAAIAFRKAADQLLQNLKKCS